MAKVSKVDRAAAKREVKLKISRDKAVELGTRKQAEAVQRHWKTVEAPRPGAGHPYATGEYVESIEIRQTRNRLGRFLSAYEVYTNHPNAGFIEYGTGPDKPGSRSPWGPNTPTPEFAPAAKTAHHFRGTAP